MMVAAGVGLILVGLVCGGVVLRHVWSGMVGAQPEATGAELAQRRQEAAALGYAASTPQIHPVRLGRKRVIERTNERRLEQQDEDPQ